MVLRASRPPRIGVTQACRPITELLRVTRTQGHWILGLDGRPALDVYREVAREPLPTDLRRAAAFLLVAIPRDAAIPCVPEATWCATSSASPRRSGPLRLPMR